MVDLGSLNWGETLYLVLGYSIAYIAFRIIHLEKPKKVKQSKLEEMYLEMEKVE